MKKETYNKMTGIFKNNTGLSKCLIISNKLCTYIVFTMYPILLIYLILQKRPELASSIIVPLDGFIVLSVFRYLINRPRPYEKFEISPVIPKDKKGQSFPSRHVYSAFIIAFTFLNVSAVNNLFLYAGIVLTVIALLIAVIRVISGVHFISDVIAAFVFAVCTQLISFFI